MAQIPGDGGAGVAGAGGEGETTAVSTGQHEAPCLSDRHGTAAVQDRRATQERPKVQEPGTAHLRHQSLVDVTSHRVTSQLGHRYHAHISEMERRAVTSYEE